MRSVLVAAMLLSGCSLIPERTVYVQEPLPVPARPHLPTIPAKALECLSEQTYADLAERDAARRAHIERLEAIIDTTHEQRDGAP